MRKSPTDTDLKAAIARAWGAEVADDALRQRVQSLFAQSALTVEAEPSAPTAARSIAERRYQIPRSPWAARIRWVSVAAVVLLSLSLTFWFARPQAAIAGQPLPNAVAVALVARHDDCCRLADHHLAPADNGSDLALTAHWLAQRVKAPVLAVMLGDGWTYCGAGPCRVDGVPSGHLIYRRGEQQLSLFSLPQGTLRPDSNYTATVDGRMIAAFTHRGGLYCLVGFDPRGALPAPQLAELRQSLITDFGAEAYTSGPPSFATTALASASN